ncbi:hypothetical protein [Nocardia sp. NPDC051832]|uniref:hypothetical protein n=1 Tax=Nocardia sp. NPDC051832 TaxID=3155673 RepID=UPI00341D1564
MGSEGDAKDNEADRSGSESAQGEFGRPVGDFGPPVGDFGPPVGDFGAPVHDFGAPVGDFGPPVDDFGGPPLDQTGPRWTTPSAPDRPGLGWRPASDAVTSPATPATPSAPSAPSTPSAPSAPSTPPAPPADFGSEAATTRYQAAPAPAPGADAKQQPPERDQWWSTPSDYNLEDDDEPSAYRRGSASGLSWADDPIAQRLAPSTPATKPDEPSSKGRWLVLGIAGALAVVIGLVVIIIAMNRNPGGEPEQTAAPAPTPAATTSQANSCQSAVEGNVTTGNGPGDTSSGEKAILGFQHAYYTDRNGALARSFVAPGANVEPPEDLQRTIDQQIPKGTTYCLRITSMAPDRFNVVVTEHHPSGNRQYFYIISTVNVEGRHLIQVIGSI